jgi:hypothetical protein
VVISSAPGTTGIYGGRPKPVPLIRLFTFFIDKKLLAPPVAWIGRDQFAIKVGIPHGYALTPPVAGEAPEDSGGLNEPTVKVPLIRLALARSGDKGDSANIAIIARDPAFVPALRREVTADRVLEHFRHLVQGPVQRFEAPGLHAFNFLLQRALGGGGMASLRIDPQGKAYAPMALEMQVRVSAEVLRRIEALAEH